MREVAVSTGEEESRLTFTRTRKEATMLLDVTNQEFATILAALRYWQRNGELDREEGTIAPPMEEYDIATDSGECEPLNADEIDELCERLNFADTATRKDERQEQLVKYALKFLVANIDETTEEDLNADADALEKELTALVGK